MTIPYLPIRIGSLQDFKFLSQHGFFKATNYWPQRRKDTKAKGRQYTDLSLKGKENEKGKDVRSGRGGNGSFLSV